MGARENILNRVRGLGCSECVAETALPQLETKARIRFEDRVAHFAEMVKAVGGEVRYCTKAEVDAAEYNIYHSHLAVAENGAVWLPCNGDRRAIFASEHLYISIAEDAICDTMHEAVEQISLQGCDFGVFVSGPSKTADIEQALVLGAHGAMQTTIIIYKP